jgi:hypothetical protein
MAVVARVEDTAVSPEAIACKFPCPSCGYELVGSRLERCPECGRAIGESDFDALGERMSARIYLPGELRRSAKIVGGVAAAYSLLAICLGSTGSAILFLIFVACAFGASVGVGWLAALPAPHQERDAWRLAWLRSHVWLHSPWMGLGLLPLLAMLFRCAGSWGWLPEEQTVLGAPPASVVLLMLLMLLAYIGSIVVGLMMWAIGWRRDVRWFQLRGRGLMLAFVIAAILTSLGFAAAIVSVGAGSLRF